MSVGNCVYPERDLPSKELIQAFRKIPAAAIGDCMDRNRALHCSIRFMFKLVKNMCGPALATQSWGRDNLFFHKVLNMAQEGNVTVMATSFYDTNPAAGESVAADTTFKKLGGLVFDVPIRDIKGIFKMEPLVYVADTTPGGPHKSAPGEINIPISYGSCFIYPGDIIAEDMGGVVVVPLGDAGAVPEAAQRYCMAGMCSQEEAAAGPWNCEWVGRDLKTAGVETIDGCCHK